MEGSLLPISATPNFTGNACAHWAYTPSHSVRSVAASGTVNDDATQRAKTDGKCLDIATGDLAAGSPDARKGRGLLCVVKGNRRWQEKSVVPRLRRNACSL